MDISMRTIELVMVIVCWYVSGLNHRKYWVSKNFLYEVYSMQWLILSMIILGWNR